MKVSWGWVQRRFWEFRIADATYLRYIISLTQFLIIVYTLYLPHVPLLRTLFASIVYFGLTFAIIYIPSCVVVGHFIHRQKQLPTEQEITILANPYLYKAQPGKELMLSLPLNKISLELNMKLWKKFGLLTPQEEKQLLEILERVDDLLKGKSIK